MFATKYDQRFTFELSPETDRKKLITTFESLYKGKIGCVIGKTENEIELLFVPEYRVINYEDPFVAAAACKIFPNIPRQPYNTFRYDLVRKIPVFYTLDHSWALLHWLSVGRDFLEERLTILHFDDHDDLGSPFLDYRCADFMNAKDPLVRRSYDILNLHDVFDAIAYGNIGIGSFILPFISLCKQIHLVHIKEDTKAIVAEKRTVDLQESHFERFHFNRLICSHVINNSSYFLYSRLSLDQITSIRDSNFIIVDIDCDYFYNINKWDNKKNELELTFEDLNRKIESVGEGIKEITKVSRILGISIAFSPDFFPSRFWEYTVKRLNKIIKDISLRP